MAAAATADKSLDYEYDDDEFDMEAEMLRREFREASLLANGGGNVVSGPMAAAAVLEPSSQTQVDLTADRRPTAAAAALAPLPSSQTHQQLQQPAAADHSSGDSSSVDSRVVGMAYAYGNQSEYTATDNTAVKHCSGKSGGGGVPSITVNSTNNNDDEYLVEQRLLGNGTDGSGGCVAAGSSSPPLPPPPSNDICSPEDRVAVAASAQ